MVVLFIYLVRFSSCAFVILLVFKYCYFFSFN